MGPRQVRYERSPSGQGSAEQWVRNRFAKEVNAYRNRQARAETALMLIIDADTHTVQSRLTQLRQALKEHGIKAISNGERTVQLIPKRKVETWILCLTEQAVDEATDYKRQRND
jgi:methylmalonyl-CoA mutase cobalamin-binding subunit